MRVYRFKPLYGFMNNIPKNHQIFDTLQVLISNTLLAAELKTIYWDLPDSTMDKDLYRYKKAANNGNLSKIHLPYSGKQIHTVFWVIDTDRKTSAIQFFETYYIW
jgi:hypothetical protein